jgi:hypothetical protein
VRRYQNPLTDQGIEPSMRVLGQFQRVVLSSGRSSLFVQVYLSIPRERLCSCKRLLTSAY